MNNLKNSFSFSLSDKTDEKGTSIEFSGTSSVLGIALIAFGLAYVYASAKKRAF